MNEKEASLIVRLMNSCANEGLGPDCEEDYDNELLNEAIVVSGLTGDDIPWWSELGPELN